MSELKLIAGYKRSSFAPKTGSVDVTVPSTHASLSDSSCIRIGVGSTPFDPTPVETLQRYLCQNGAVQKSPGWLRIDNVILEFFSIPSQSELLSELVDNFASYDGVILCFSKDRVNFFK